MDRVDRARRFVENQQLRVAEQAACDPEALFHPRRECIEPPVEIVGEVDQAHDLGDTPAQPGAVQAGHRAEVLEVPAGGQPIVEASVVGAAQDDFAPDGERRGSRIDPVDANRPAVGDDEAGHDPQDRALAGTVRADDPEQLAAAHAERDVVQGNAALDPSDISDPWKEAHRRRKRLRELVDVEIISWHGGACMLSRIKRHGTGPTGLFTGCLAARGCLRARARRRPDCGQRVLPDVSRVQLDEQFMVAAASASVIMPSASSETITLGGS